MPRSRKDQLRLYAERDGSTTPEPAPETAATLPVVVLEARYYDGTHYAWCVHCPACDAWHTFDERWTFDGNRERPTFSPSMLARVGPEDQRTVCHSFLTAGVWHYLADCTHELRNRHVAAPPASGTTPPRGYG